MHSKMQQIGKPFAIFKVDQQTRWRCEINECMGGGVIKTIK